MSQQYSITAGIDLGDRYSYIHLLDTESGEMIEESRISTNREAIKQRFAGVEPMHIAIEASGHSPWVSRALESCGHKVLVANARKVKLIYAEGKKNDRVDAEKLARLARVDPRLLSPIEHRGEGSQAHLALVRSRNALVGVRTKLVNHIRGTVKSFGSHLPQCSAESFHYKVPEHLPQELVPALQPMLEHLTFLAEQIKDYDRKLKRVAEEFYPETNLLQQVKGVGMITSLTFVLTLEDSGRFVKSRDVGAYFGLVPKTDQSGESDPEKNISKRGDMMMRKLLVGSAHYILGPFGEDCDLRRHGERIASGGGKNAKKRAVVAVARKLSVLLHHLWASGEVYDPLYNANRSGGQAA